MNQNEDNDQRKDYYNVIVHTRHFLIDFSEIEESTQNVKTH